MDVAGGNGSGTPFPVTVTSVGELVALLMIVTVALEEIVPRGAKITSNEAVAEGAKTRGKVGRFASVKKLPAIAMELTVREVWPVLVIVMVCLDDVVIGTLPKATGLGAMARLGRTGAFTVSAALVVDTPYVADKFTKVSDATALVEIANVAEFVPAGIFMVGGTLAIALLLLASVTVAPTHGARLTSETVPVDV
jgi:hypothetical protein